MQLFNEYVLSISGLQLQGQEATQGLQTLTMTNVNPTTATPTSAPGATIVQYAQGPDGQFYIPGNLPYTQLDKMSANISLTAIIIRRYRLLLPTISKCSMV